MALLLRIETKRAKEAVDVTDRVNEAIATARMQEGLCVLLVAHTTAALTTGEVGEGTEDDLLEVVEQVIPRIRFRHAHDPSHAWSHMASSLVGPSLALPVSEGRLLLGTWQSVLLIELDGPRRRDIHMQLLPA
ncbi:MAG TPA: secondary thiamine-phosphate synthase enzyme YjbQ [Nitrospiraceae bacterium]|nr:secondary thiamine-phosphate synthase enzyme YjbQ [Nitrospiraceae bacterium]